MKNGTTKGQTLMKRKHIILKINIFNLILLPSETLLKLQQRNSFIKHKPTRRLNKILRAEK